MDYIKLGKAILTVLLLFVGCGVVGTICATPFLAVYYFFGSTGTNILCGITVFIMWVWLFYRCDNNKGNKE